MTPESERIVALVKSYSGVSLDNEPGLLGQLVARGVDDPKLVVGIKTNCATTALGFLKILGVKHELLHTPYKIGQAVVWLFRIGRDFGIARQWRGDRSMLIPGCLLHYVSPGKSDDHVEWLLGEPDEKGVAFHGGGGRPRNAITTGTSTVLWSSGRPLRWVFDVPAALRRQNGP